MEQLIQFTEEHLEMIYVLILLVFIGIEVIKNVPSVLHTPLMSGANALSGVVIIGAILVMMETDPEHYLVLALGFAAIVLGIINVVGGFVVTDRMLEMFKKSKK